jgi:hypothetical protein
MNVSVHSVINVVSCKNKCFEMYSGTLFYIIKRENYSVVIPFNPLKTKLESHYETDSISAHLGVECLLRLMIRFYSLFIEHCCQSWGLLSDESVGLSIVLSQCPCWWYMTCINVPCWKLSICSILYKIYTGSLSLKVQINLDYIQTFSLHCTVDTICLTYKNQSFNTV